jgi:iron(III) transport system substrate-binding protein
MSRIFAAAVAIVIASAAAAVAQVPASYPADYAKVIEAGNREGKLVVYGNIDAAAAAQVLRDFASLFPLVRVDYVELNSNEIYTQYLGEVAAGADTADLLWTSGMDGQLKMVAQATRRPTSLRSFPRCRNGGVAQPGLSARPTSRSRSSTIRNCCRKRTCPRDHSELLALLVNKPAAFKGRITAYDRKVRHRLSAHQSGYQEFSAGVGPVSRVRQERDQLSTAADDMLQAVIQGEQTIGYGIFGSYATAPRQAGARTRHRHPEGLHAGSFRIALIHHQGEAAECRQAVSRLPVVATGPDRHRHPGRPLRNAQRCSRRDDRAGIDRADRRQRSSDTHRREFCSTR